MLVATDEDMALRKEDREWISEEIRRSAEELATKIETLRPHGWKRALYLLREWGVLGSFITAFVALGALAMNQWSAANNRLAEERVFRENTDGRLDRIESDMSTLKTMIAASQPLNKSSQGIVKQAIADARNTKIEIPSDVVERAGDSFLDAAPKSDGAWDVALQLAAYRSSRARLPETGPTIPAPSTGPRHYDLQKPWEDAPTPQITLSEEIVSVAQSAKLGFIGDDVDIWGTTGPKFLILRGGTTKLDDMKIRNAIFVKVQVYYDGGPVDLAGVTFIDCTFSMTNKQSARELARAIIAGSSAISAKLTPGV